MIPRDEVHLWAQRLDVGADELAGFAGLLSSDERERAARFRFDVHRNRYTAARGRLREILGSYLGVEAAHVAFAYNAFGKPSLADAGSPLRFNVSHSGEVAAYGVTWGREIGVDVEEECREHSRDRIPESFFSPGEVRALRSLPMEEQNAAFFRCWTRKEAYVKALAEGLNIPLDSFDVSLLPGERARFVRNGEGWSMASFRVEPGYAGAIVAAGEDWTWRVAEAGGLRVVGN